MVGHPCICGVFEDIDREQCNICDFPFQSLSFDTIFFDDWVNDNFQYDHYDGGTKQITQSLDSEYAVTHELAPEVEEKYASSSDQVSGAGDWDLGLDLWATYFPEQTIEFGDGFQPFTDLQATRDLNDIFSRPFGDNINSNHLPGSRQRSRSSSSSSEASYSDEPAGNGNSVVAQESTRSSITAQSWSLPLPPAPDLPFICPTCFQKFMSQGQLS